MVNFPRWKVILVLGICVLGIAFCLPNFLPAKVLNDIPDWLPKQKVNLGLDLRGGSQLLLQVDEQSVLKDYMQGLVDSIRVNLRDKHIGYQHLGIQGDGVDVTIREANKLDTARQAIRGIDPQTQMTVDGQRIRLALTQKLIADRRSAAVQQSIEIVRRRIDETGVREPTIQRQGEDRILVQVPGLKNPEHLKKLLGKTAKLTFHLLDSNHSVQEALAGRVPPGDELLPSSNEKNAQGSPRMYLVQKQIMVSGASLVDAQPSFDQRTNQPIVTFRFDAVGAKKFADVTTKHVGEPFAIVLDQKVISAPVIREPIIGGSGQISGGFTTQETNDLALLLRAGALPAPLNVVEERTVGPGLGQDSIEAGKIASAVGLVAVIVFMVIAYGLFGLYADVALAANIVLILAALSLLQATLTLPGIAGIVLTIGMAVDANVLIYERIREEVRLGRTPISSIDAGYSRALTTIIDSNVTTLVAAVLLYIFGSGPVRGFAVTLAIGIVTSVFTAVMLSRLLVVTWLKRRRPTELPL